MQAYLLNIKRNSDWIDAYTAIINNQNPNNKINRHARRNMQDWAKFLSAGELFDLHNSTRCSTLIKRVEGMTAKA
jgi:hypothetical protein